eukprot:gene38783-47899_t
MTERPSRIPAVGMPSTADISATFPLRPAIASSHSALANISLSGASVGTNYLYLGNYSVADRDVNNDTFADIIIGAPCAGSKISGAVY